ncbi:universal stress protein [bacterium]|nr:universal stress protein [bacterium]
MVTIKTILVPTDFSELSKIALPYAIDIAKKYSAKVVIFHVFDEELLSPIFFEAGGKAEKYFNHLKNDFDSAIKQLLDGIDTGDLEIEAHLANGSPFVEILRYVKENGVDLVVMGTHGRSGISHAFLGSVTEKVMRKSPAPVMIVRHPEMQFKMI